MTEHEIVFQAIYDNCMLPEHRCKEIADKVIEALQRNEVEQ